MYRVLLAGLKHEANTFVPGVADLGTFRRHCLLEGQEIFGSARGSGQEIDGFIQVARQAGVELLPTIAASASAAPPVADSAHGYIRDKVLAGARAQHGKLDGVILSLHGAMTTESLEDPEGSLAAAVREIVGPAVPIVVSFDMHCHFTDQKGRAADAIVGYHTHPHVDFEDTGVRAMRILVKAMRGEARPVVAYRKLRMIASAENHNTGRPPMKDIMDCIAAMEREPGILAATIFPTQPWMDVTELAWSTVVVADGNKALAQGRADELARMAWDRREAFLVQKTPVREAVEKALASDKHPFVLADSSDSVTGGAYGDGNVLLRTLLEMGYRDRALLTLTDPEAVAACFAAGVGGEVSVALGGKLAPQFYRPVTVNGRVKTLSDGWYVRELPPGPIGIGRTAVLEIGRISVLLSERPAPTIDQEAYHSVGLEPRNAKIVQVKSPGGFRAIYGPFAAGIFELAAPGPTDSELTRLPFKKIRRPLWPFDPELTAPW
jgi:microcystin degradation protein MlrC